MPMTLRAKHEQAGRERALMSANCVALAADEAKADVIRFSARGASWSCRGR